MDQLYACPFCRQLFTKGEVEVCPECDIGVKPLADLPPSHEAELLDEPSLDVPPQDEALPLSYMGRSRGMLIMVALMGFAVFFAPWYHELTPDQVTWSGYEFAKRLPWLWAAGVAWLVMVPLAVSRRSIRQMRGARVAIGFLAAMVLTTVVARLTLPVSSLEYVALRYSWGWGMYGAAFLSLIALVLAVRFGGTLADMPTKQNRRGDETLH